VGVCKVAYDFDLEKAKNINISTYNPLLNFNFHSKIKVLKESRTIGETKI